MGGLEEQKRKAVGTTKFFFHVPKPRRTLVYLLAWSFVAGLVNRAIYGKISLGGLVVFGGADGVLLLALPALFAALLAAGFASPRDFRSAFRYYLFLAFCASILAAVGYAVGVTANRFAGFNLLVSFLVVNALVACLWFLVSFVALNAKWRSAPISLLQPFFNLAFIFLWSRISFLEAGVTMESPVIAGFKLLLATAVLLLALWSLFYVINAPAKRNLGVSAIQAAALFFAQTIRGSKDFERVLEEMGEPALMPVRAFEFKTLGGKPKALFVIPSLHFGPFGNVGGSEYPVRLSAELGQRHGTTFVWHGLVNHDFNPVDSSDYARVAAAIEKALREAEMNKNEGARTAGFFESRAGAANIAGLAFGGSGVKKNATPAFAFATVSRFPESTEDFDYGLGEALRNACGARLRAECVIADRHNCLTDGTEVSAGGEAFAEYEEAARGIAQPKQASFKLGVAAFTETGFSPQQGVGRAGIRAAVFEIGRERERERRKRYCLVLIDANNCTPAFRARAVESLKRKFGFDWVEIATSDTHSVNSLAGIYNPLPGGASGEALVKQIELAAEKALQNLEPCKAWYAESRVWLDVMGAESQSEMLSTINAIIAVAKIIAPAILVLSILLVTVALLVWK
ncbi:MAG: DUF2070 family protein [Candidatus Micrarchaeota archaeon]